MSFKQTNNRYSQFSQSNRYSQFSQSNNSNTPHVITYVQSYVPLFQVFPTTTRVKESKYCGDCGSDITSSSYRLCNGCYRTHQEKKQQDISRNENDGNVQNSYYFLQWIPSFSFRNFF